MSKYPHLQFPLPQQLFDRARKELEQQEESKKSACSFIKKITSGTTSLKLKKQQALYN